jgi:hypothetical protein
MWLLRKRVRGPSRMRSERKQVCTAGLRIALAHVLRCCPPVVADVLEALEMVLRR